MIVEALRQREATQQPLVSPEEWTKRFEEYMQEVAARACRYPSGFALDDSRQTMYQGRGE
jgi:hypothetical protein